MKSDLQLVEEIIKSEVNVKEVNYISGDAGLVKKKTKPNFRTLGKKLGKHMKEAAELIQNFNEEEISQLEKDLNVKLDIDNQPYLISKEDVEILSEDIPGWLVSHDGELTVALDINLSDELISEGNARELINRIQNLRKDKNFNVTDKIEIKLQEHKDIINSLNLFKELISSEVLADAIEFSNEQFIEHFDWLEDEKIGYQIHVIAI